MQNISRERADCIVLVAYYMRAGNCVINLAMMVLILHLNSSRKKGNGGKKIMLGILCPIVKKA